MKCFRQAVYVATTYSDYLHLFKRGWKWLSQKLPMTQNESCLEVLQLPLPILLYRVNNMFELELLLNLYLRIIKLLRKCTLKCRCWSGVMIHPDGFQRRRWLLGRCDCLFHVPSMFCMPQWIEVLWWLYYMLTFLEWNVSCSWLRVSE